MAPRQKTFTPDTLDSIYAELHSLKEQIRLLHRTPSFIERLNPVTLPDPVEGQVAIDSRTNCFIYYADGAWRSKCSAVHALKVFGDQRLNRVRDGAFKFSVEQDLADTEISLVEAHNGTIGTGATNVQISNRTRGFDILTTPLTIPSGLYDSNGTEVIDEGGLITDPNNKVHLYDRIWVDVDAVGAGSKGLHVYVTFHGPRVDLTP